MSPNRCANRAETIKIVEVANLPVQVNFHSNRTNVNWLTIDSRQYVTNQATRIIVKAAGELSADFAQFSEDVGDVKVPVISGTEETEEVDKQALESMGQDKQTDVNIDIEGYVPAINEAREWVLSELDLGTLSASQDFPKAHFLKFTEWIADGCGVLGTGGGGSSYPPFLVARQMLRGGHPIKVRSNFLCP